MSEHGTFITRQIICDTCREELFKALDCAGCVYPTKLFKLVPWHPDEPNSKVWRAIGGCVEAMAIDEEGWGVLDAYIRHQIEEAICHPVEMFVMTDAGSIYQISFVPGGDGTWKKHDISQV